MGEEVSQVPDEMDAADVGEGEIKEDEVGLEFPGQLQGLAAVFGFAHHPVAHGLGENGLEAFPEDRVVIHDDDSLVSGHLPCTSLEFRWQAWCPGRAGR